MTGSVRESLADSRTAIGEVFANRNLRKVNLAFAGSVIGDWAYAVAMSVYAYTHGGATTVGVVAVIRYVSMAVVAPFTAMAADRCDRRLVMVMADVVRVALVLTAAACIFFDGPAVVVYSLAILTSVVGTAFRPAQGALMPSLANHPGELAAANVASSTIESVGFFAGPAVGGLLLAVSGVAAVYTFDALTFAWSAYLVWQLRPAAPTPATADDPAAVQAGDEAGDPAGDGAVPGEPQGRGRLFAGVGEGYREILGNRDVRLLVGLYCAQTVVAGAGTVATVAIALDLLALGKGGLGVLNAAVGVGGLAGGVVALLLAQRGRLARDFGLGVILWAAPLLIIAAWPTLIAALTAMVLVGVGNSIVDVNAFTILQRLVPEQVMGRVFGAMESAVIGGMAFGALAMPILINTVGLRSGLTVIGAVVSLVVVVAMTGLKHIDKVALAPEGLELLRAVPILGLLPEEVLEQLARRSRIVAVPSGERIFSEGDFGDRYFIIETGTVDLSAQGKHLVTLASGDSFGEIALLRDVPRTGTVVATSDVITRTIERDDFLQAVTGHHEAAKHADALVTRLLGVR